MTSSHCLKCNGQGYFIEQPLSSKALLALADACPHEPVAVIAHRCDCGTPDRRNGPLPAAFRAMIEAATAQPTDMLE